MLWGLGRKLNNMAEDLKPKIKVAPHSKESEMMVLGCMLTSINALNVGADGLDDTDFYFTENQIIFQVLKGAYVNDRPADVHLVCEELRRARSGPQRLCRLSCAPLFCK
jgi:replicative DNA helicase